MLGAALTLIPAIVSLIGTTVFWPSKSWQRKPEGATFQRLGRFVGRRPGVTAAVSGGVLVALAAGTLGLSVNFDQTGQLPDDTESARAFEELQAGFPAGAINSTSVYLQSTNGDRIDEFAAEEFASRLGEIDGVGQVVPAGEGGSTVVLGNEGTWRRSTCSWTVPHTPTRRSTPLAARSATLLTPVHRRAPRHWSAGSARRMRTCATRTIATWWSSSAWPPC